MQSDAVRGRLILLFPLLLSTHFALQTRVFLVSFHQMSVRLGAALLSLLLGTSASPLPLFGYICPTCPSTPAPAVSLATLPSAYTSVALAFAGWDASGVILNQWDAPDKGFVVNASVVAALRTRGVKVFLSAGGGAGNTLPGDVAPPGFAANMLAGLSSLVTAWELDGVDFDLENWPGAVSDIVAACVLVRAVIAGLRAAHPALLISAAPQMTDVYPDYPSITAGFNRYAPLLSQRLFDAVMPQMYNSWAAVETLAYARVYAGELTAGFAVASPPMLIPPVAPWLGFPASRSAAGSGFLPPADVVSMARGLGKNCSGLMTWDIGWDELAGWQFANAVAAG